MVTAKQINDIRESLEMAMIATMSERWQVKMHHDNYGQGYGCTTYYVDAGTELIKIGVGEDRGGCAKISSISRFIASAPEYVSILLAEVQEEAKNMDSSEQNT